ncbi:MAG: N4-gp56 family major capsid protein [bacterium]|nr:N4-gp56 family major capsid protein [bacterium]
MGNTVSTDALRPELWGKEVWKNVIDGMYFTNNGLMGTGENNVIQIMDNLKKSKGDTITVPLTAKLTGNGVNNDAELEGNEEKINPYSESINIAKKRFAVRLTGTLDEQKNAFNMRTDAKNKLSMRLQEFIEQQVFLKLGGVTNTTLTDVAGNVVGTDCAWSNTPAYVPDADTAAGYGDRYLGADYSSGATSLAAADQLSPELISRAKTKAMQKQSSGMPKVTPLRINGESHYVMFIHPWQAFDLKNNAVFAQAQREAQTRGRDNPIFTGALGIWDNVVIKVHEYVPFLDASVAGNSFRGAATGTDFAVDAFRALLCGQQACVMAKAGSSDKMVEKLFNYDDQVGYAVSFMGGIQKIEFDSKDYGVVAVDTAATALV